MISVIMADDHPLVRVGIKKVLQNTIDIELAGEASNSKELMSLLRDELPDIVILDISMPGKSGLDTMKDIVEWYPELPVLILSMRSEERMAVRVLKAGAQGYINKSGITKELVKAIRIITQQKKRYINPKVAELLALQIDDKNDGPLHKTLSDREFEIMCYIASGDSVQKISEDMCLSRQTVYTYRSRIKEKMGLQSNVEITRYVLENNLIEQV